DERATHLLYRQFRNTARVAKNAVSDLVVKMGEDPNLEFEQIRPYVSGLKGKLALENGDVDAGVLTAGQVMGLIHDIPTCQTLIDNIMQEAEQIVQQRLAQFFPR
ncbi:nitronate monooxygenase, partial [Escherichia coli]|nr:nitronate monooxygenase [Escherichia coli]